MKPAIAPKKITRSTRRAARPSSSCFGSRTTLAKPGQPRRNSALRVKFWRGSAHNHSRPPEIVSALPTLHGSRKASLRPHDPLPAWLFHPFVLRDVGQASKRREQL